MPVSKKRRNNKRKPAPTARKKPALEPVSEPAPPLPDRRALEGVMAKLAGGLSSGFDGSDGDDAALWQAQELMYEAWDTRRGGHLCVAKQGKLDGDAGRLAMARRNRANSAVARRKTALNGKTPCIFVASRKFL